MPAVSVIMGVHNGGPFLADAVASIRQQTLADWELVLVENGSTDGAIDALEAGETDLRVRVLRFSEPLRPGGSLRIACEQSCSPYLAVLDQDDLALPRRLELQRDFLERRPEISLVAAGTEDIDETGRHLSFEPLVALHEDIYAVTAYVHALRHSSVMFRRELLSQVAYRPELGGASDFDLFARAAEVSRLAALPEVLCRYRVHTQNETVRFGGRTAAAGGLARMLTRRRRSGLAEEFTKWEAVFSAFVQPGATEGRVHCDCANLFRREGHPDLAALHAWIGWRTGGGLQALWEYLAAVAGGYGRSPRMLKSLIKAWGKEPAHQMLRAGAMPDRLQF